MEEHQRPLLRIMEALRRLVRAFQNGLNLLIPAEGVGAFFSVVKKCVERCILQFLQDDRASRIWRSP
jgi:hypothetical protein